MDFSGGKVKGYLMRRKNIVFCRAISICPESYGSSIILGS
jgi:hypothetical protein